MISLLFWQFANDIVRTKEAKRFYAMFGLIANIALILAGFLGKFYYQVSINMTTDGDPWGLNLIFLDGSVVIAGLLTIFHMMRWICTNVLTDPQYYSPEDNQKSPKKKKEKMGFTDSLKFLVSSKYLAMIALLVLCYGISINLIELLWKEQVKTQYPNPNDYKNFMDNLAIGTGIFTMLVILLSKGVVSKTGWFKGAIVTPLMILITGMLFFSFIFLSDYLDPVTSALGVSALMMAVWLGLIQNILSKGVKYGLFDPTKEMAYIPLDKTSKTKGKAAVDVIGGRLGKAAGDISPALF